MIKQTVMTTVYGVTMNGARRQIERQLKAIGIDSDQVLYFSVLVLLENGVLQSNLVSRNNFTTCLFVFQRMKYATYLAEKTFRSLNDAFTSSMYDTFILLHFLHDCFSVYFSHFSQLRYFLNSFQENEKLVPRLCGSNCKTDAYSGVDYTSWFTGLSALFRN